MRKRIRRPIRAEASSGNVFSDLGIPNAGELDVKARLAVEINRLIEGRGLSRVEAAARLKLGRQKVTASTDYKLDGFSVERLLMFLLALGRDPEIRIKAGKADGSPWRDRRTSLWIKR